MANTEKMAVAAPSKIFLEVKESAKKQIAVDSANGDRYVAGLILEKDANGKLVAYGTTVEDEQPVGEAYAVLMEDVNVKSAEAHAEVLMAGKVNTAKLVVLSNAVTLDAAADELRKNNIHCVEVM